MSLIAIQHTCRQYSEDGWESVHRVLKLTPETTVREIVEWAWNKKVPIDQIALAKAGPLTIETLEETP